MADKEIERKIAVIFATDVVGYSKSVEKNEEQTIKNFRSCKKILEALFKEHGGRIFNTAGDSVLAEFSSAVSAVICATEFQRLLKERNESETTDMKMEFRIGVNMGDVVVEGDNLYGDGVNIAARLEALAQPNGVCISRSVHEFINKKLEFLFNDLGEQTVKENKFHAFDVLIDERHKRKIKTKSKSKTPLVGVIVLVLILGLICIYFFTNTTVDKSSIYNAATTSSKPSILVAPIKASGLKADQEFFGTGITESMVSILSQYKAIKVLSSNTSFHVAKTEMLDADIRDLYGVDFLIRGSIQVIGKNARLNVEITDLKLEEVSVSKKRDFNLNDIFKVQDDLSNEILNEMQINLGVGSGQGKRWVTYFKSIEDFTKFLNFRDEWRLYTKDGHINAQRILDELKILYPDSGEIIYVMEAWQIYQRIIFQLSLDIEKDLERLKFLTNKAIELNPGSDTYAARALIGLRLLKTGCESALNDMIKSEENGGTVDTLTIGSAVYANCGDLKKAIDSSRSALKLLPNDTGWFVTANLVILLYETGQIDEIYKLIGKNVEAKDMEKRVLAIYAFLAHKKGNKELAEEYLSRAKNNGFTRNSFLSSITNKELLDETINELIKIGTLE